MKNVCLLLLLSLSLPLCAVGDLGTEAERKSFLEAEFAKLGRDALSSDQIQKRFKALDENLQTTKADVQAAVKQSLAELRSSAGTLEDGGGIGDLDADFDAPSVGGQEKDRPKRQSSRWRRLFTFPHSGKIAVVGGLAGLLGATHLHVKKKRALGEPNIFERMWRKLRRFAGREEKQA